MMASVCMVTGMQQAPGAMTLGSSTCEPLVQAFSQLVDVVAEDQLTQVLLPALLQKAEDPVPNVKFNVSKVLQVSAPLMPPRVCRLSMHLSVAFCFTCIWLC